MPKESLSLNNFEGGLNTWSDPRDIGGENDNQVSGATGVDLSNPGTVKTQVSGKIDTTINVQSVTVESSGVGLTSFSSDYNNAGTYSPTDYYVHTLGSNSKFYDGAGTEATNLSFATNWGDTDPVATYFIADGGIRVCDSSFDNVNANNVVKMTKFVKNDGFSSLGTSATGEWVSGVSASLNPPNVHYMTKMTPTDATVASAWNNGTIYIGFEGAADTQAIGWGAGAGSDVDSTDGTDGQGASTLVWNVGISYVYDGNQESNVMQVAVHASHDGYQNTPNWVDMHDISSASQPDEVRFNSSKKYRIVMAFPDTATGVSGSDARGKTITMIKVYMRKVTSSKWFLVAEADMVEGIRNPFDDDFQPWDNTTESGTITARTPYKLEPPTAITYRSETGYDNNEISTTTARFKTGVVTNRRAYIGNVLQSGSAFGDRMIKTGANAFDIYPQENWIDVAINDGDNITKLEVYADRLFQ